MNAITVKNVSDDAMRRALGYAYDDASRIAQFTATGADPTIYGYDAAGQLVAETRGSYAASYQYDGNGNRTSRTVNGVTEAYAYDDGDKLQSVTCGTDVRAFAYDERGRRTEEYLNGVLKRTYAWNEDDRLAGIAYSNPPGTPFAGAYGPDGARVGKTDSGGTRTFLRSGPGVTAPVLSDGAATYTPGVSEVRSGVSTFVTGGLKNQNAQWSSAGALMATRQYDAFGNLVGSSGSWQGPFGYGGAYGYQEDASGLKLLGHRYYDPSTGSFLSRDPIKDGRNWYAYCAGDPVRAVDVDGLVKIMLIWRPIEHLSAANHLIIVIVDNVASSPTYGQTWVIEGGPSDTYIVGGGGHVTGRPVHVDAQKLQEIMDGKVGGLVLVDDQSGIGGWLERAALSALGLSAERKPYERLGTGRNSNSFATALLNELGLADEATQALRKRGGLVPWFPGFNQW